MRSLLQNQGVLEQTAVDTVDIMKVYKVNSHSTSHYSETVMPVMVQKEVILKAVSILGKGTEIMKGQMKFVIFRIYLLTCSDHLVETCVFVFHCLFFLI